MNYIDDHILRFVSRKELPDEMKKLKERLGTDPAYRNDLKQWLTLWDMSNMTNMSNKFNSTKAYQRFMHM